MKSISIIIPTYNNYEQLLQCVVSIYESDFRKYRKNIELIIVDDGSTDATRKIRKHFPDIRYFRKKNKGPGAARNFGAEKSRHGMLMFIEDDFVVPKNFFSKISHYNKEYDLISCKAYYEGDNHCSLTYQAVYDAHIYRTISLYDQSIAKQENTLLSHIKFLLQDKESFNQRQKILARVKIPVSCLIISKKIYLLNSGFPSNPELEDLEFMSKATTHNKLLFLQKIKLIHNSYSNERELISSMNRKIREELTNYSLRDKTRKARLLLAKTYDFITWIKFCKSIKAIRLLSLIWFMYLREIMKSRCSKTTNNQK